MKMKKRNKKTPNLKIHRKKLRKKANIQTKQIQTQKTKMMRRMKTKMRMIIILNRRMMMIMRAMNNI